MKQSVGAVLLILFSLCIWDFRYSVGESYSGECQTWAEEIKRIQSDEERVNVTCQVNTQCSGIDCKGLYSYDGPLSSGKYEKSVCFGLWMDPCKSPTELTVYIEQTSDKISFVHTITANENDGHDETEIPGAEESLDVPLFEGAGKIEVTIVTDFKSEMLGSRNYVTLGLQLKPKISILGGVYEEYPDELQVWLVKDVEVPVPPCENSVVMPTHTAHTCPNISLHPVTEKRPDPPQSVVIQSTGSDYVMLSWMAAPVKDGIPPDHFVAYYTEKGGKPQQKTTEGSFIMIDHLKVNTSYTIYVVAVNAGGTSNASSSVMATTTPKPSGNTGTLFHSCNPSGPVLKACGNNELCDPGTKKCVCIPGEAYLQNSATCVRFDAMDRTTASPVILTDKYGPGEAESQHSDSKKSKKVLITAVCSVLAVVVAAIVATVVALHYWKKKARYSQHELLRNEDDTADDGDVAPIDP